MDKEIWKPIKGYEGYYEISNYGRVKSVERYVQQGNYMRHVKESFKGISADKYGYPRVTLCKNRVSRSHLLHVLLAKAFIPNPECKPQVDHVNTNKGDYSLSNLRWVTPKENSNNPNTLEHCRKNTYIKETAIKANRTKKKEELVLHLRLFISSLWMENILLLMIVLLKQKEIRKYMILL